MNLPSDSGNSALLTEPKHVNSSDYTQHTHNAQAPFPLDDGLGRGAGGHVHSSQFHDGGSLGFPPTHEGQ